MAKLCSNSRYLIVSNQILVVSVKDWQLGMIPGLSVQYGKLPLKTRNFATTQPTVITSVGSKTLSSRHICTADAKERPDGPFM